MDRAQFIEVLRSQVKTLTDEQTKIRKSGNLQNNDVYHRFKKLGHEISAIENTIKEFERV